MAKKTIRSKKGDSGTTAIRRVWGDVDVVDADRDLRLVILPEDIQHAQRKEAASCVFAQACKRVFGSTKVLFFRSTAYVGLPDSSGREKVERFMMSSLMRNLIEDFDRGKATIPRAGFLLKAPAWSKRLENERRRKVATRKKREMLMGHSEATEYKMRRGKQGLGKYEDKPLLIDLSVRSGVGAVHFPMKKGR